MKRLLWLLPAAALLAAAFLAPKLLLSTQIEQHTASRSSVAAPAALEQSESTSIMDALLLLSDADTQFLYYSLRNNEEGREISDAFFRELEVLYSTDAITSSMQTMFNRETIDISDYYLVNPNSSTTILLHEIHDAASDSYAIYEPKSGKILKLLYYINSSSLLWEAANQYSDKDIENYERQLSAWASYYSLNADRMLYNVMVGTVRPDLLPSMMQNRLFAAACALSDGSGRRVGITLCSTYQAGSIDWHILCADDFDLLLQMVAADTATDY